MLCASVESKGGNADLRRMSRVNTDHGEEREPSIAASDNNSQWERFLLLLDHYNRLEPVWRVDGSGKAWDPDRFKTWKEVRQREGFR